MKMALTLSAALVAVASFAVAHEGHDHAQADKLKETDALMAAAQKVCPVTGEPLDAMGGPIKAKSGERTIFLCCKGCLGKPIKPEVWKQVQKNLREAQGICPVMKNPLPENAASTVVEGRTVFVCCKGCIEKVKADPRKAITFVDARLKQHAEAEKQAEAERK
jgi:hypothetical protein